jgi:threonine dehydratase
MPRDTIIRSHAADSTRRHYRRRPHVYQAAVRTPLIKLDLPFASAPARPEVYLKLESLQPIGSFKIRGAWNAVRKLSPRR